MTLKLLLILILILILILLIVLLIVPAVTLLFVLEKNDSHLTDKAHEAPM